MSYLPTLRFLAVTLPMILLFQNCSKMTPAIGVKDQANKIVATDPAVSVDPVTDVNFDDPTVFTGNPNQGVPVPGADGSLPGQPPAGSDPVQPPVAGQPGMQQPPATQPPSSQPPSSQPPVAGGEPGVQQPPVAGQPGSQQPPVIQPPSSQPPTSQPPVAGQPGAGQPGAGHHDDDDDDHDQASDHHSGGSCQNGGSHHDDSDDEHHEACLASDNCGHHDAEEAARSLCEHRRGRIDISGFNKCDAKKGKEFAQEKDFDLIAANLAEVANMKGKVVIEAKSSGLSIGSVHDNKGRIIICNMDVGTVAGNRGHLTVVNGNIGEIKSHDGRISVINGKVLKNSADRKKLNLKAF